MYQKQKNIWIKSEIYMQSYFHAFKTISGKPYLVTFLKLSPPLATCNSQLQGMTAPPPALLSLPISVQSNK